MVEFNVHDGHMLSAEYQRIAEIIHDYDPELELAWVPPDKRELNEEFPFAVIHRPKKFEPYVVMRLRAGEIDHRVLARLWSADHHKGNNILSQIEAEEAARKAVELKRQMEEEEERKEYIKWAVRAPVGAKHNGVRLT